MSVDAARKEDPPSEHAAEADLATLRKSLAALGHQVEEAQARVIATIEAKHAEFVSAATQIGDLQGSVGRLQSELVQTAALLRQEPQQRDEAPVAALRTAVVEHSRLREELAALDSAATVLTAVLSAQQQLAELDRYNANPEQYEEAAKLTLQVANTLKSISAPSSASEPAMVRAAKTQYYQRRTILTTRLEERLERLLTFGDCSATACDAAALGRVWAALDTLDLRSRRVEHLADQALRVVARPLIESAKRLPAGRRLRANVVTAGKDGKTWSWAEESTPETVSGAVGSKPSAREVLPVLTSFFDFAWEHWAAGHKEVYALLGRKIYPVVAGAMLQHFDTCGGPDHGEVLERFELDMIKRGLIGIKEKTLARHAEENRKIMGEHRRAAVLEEARAWLLAEESSLVAVSDAEEPGSVTKLLAASGSDRNCFVRALEEDESLLRLPDMQVSPAAHKTARRVRELLDEAVLAVEEGRTEAARDLGKLAREVVTLFSVLRPFAHKAQLRTSPRCGAVFLADCLYLTHVLILLPYTYGERLPADLQQIAFLADLVPQIRRLGEGHFLALLKHQQEQLLNSLRPFDLEAGISSNRAYGAADAALGAAVQQAKLAAQGMSAALPSQLLGEMAGSLLGVVCKDMLSKLFKLPSAQPDEVGNISALLISAVGLCRQVLLVAGIEGRDAESVPGWTALQVTADLLGSDFSRFLEKRAGLLQALSRQEVVRLMQLSWRDEALTPEEAWDVLQNASQPDDS